MSYFSKIKSAIDFKMESKKEALEDLKMTREEFDRITEAMKNEEFRKLFVEYCEEISDPENRKTYEEEIKILESQRGVDCQFVHPSPGYVIKTTTDGEQKVFINVAKNDLVQKPKCERGRSPADGKPGINWSLPLMQAPPRKDMDLKNQWCIVYDVIFHPDTLALADRDKRFRNMVNDTAIDAISQAFNVKLDCTNLKFPKLTYKGTPKPTVIRKNTNDESKVEDLGPLKDIMPPLPKNKAPVIRRVEQRAEQSLEYTCPKYIIKYQKNLEMHEFTEAYDAKIAAALPTYVVIEIKLPLIKTATDIELDVSCNRLYLCSEKPAKYKLELKLPYEVDDTNSLARFDSDKRLLSVTLSVLQPRIGVPEILETKTMVDNVSFDDVKESSNNINNRNVEVLKGEEAAVVSSLQQEGESVHVDIDDTESKFFDEEINYQVPTFCVRLQQNETRLVITLDTLNVDPGTLQHKLIGQEIFIKYENVAAGFFSMNYGIVFKLEHLAVDSFKAFLYCDRVRLFVDFTFKVPTDFGLFHGPPLGVLEYKSLKDMMTQQEADGEVKGDDQIDFNEAPEYYERAGSTLEFENTAIYNIQK